MLPLITQEEAARVLSRSVRTLTLWRRKGVGPAFYRIAGRGIRYSADDLDDFISRSRVESAQTHSADGITGAI